MAGTRMAAVLRSTALPVEPGVTHSAGVWEEGPVALRLVVDVPQNDSTCSPGPTVEPEPATSLVELDPSRQQSDAIYVSRLLEKNARAWRDFVARYGQMLRRSIMRTAKSFRSFICAADIDEIYASLLCSLTERDMHKLRVFDADRGRNLGSWLSLLAVNETYNYMRRLARRLQTTSIDPDTCPLEQSDADSFTILSLKERADWFNGLIRDLSDKDRTLLRLLSEEETPERIAEIMEISVTTVYTKKHKVQCKLKAHAVRPRAIAGSRASGLA